MTQENQQQPDACGIRAIDPRPERQGFPRNSGKAIRALHSLPAIQIKALAASQRSFTPPRAWCRNGHHRQRMQIGSSKLSSVRLA